MKRPLPRALPGISARPWLAGLTACLPWLAQAELELRLEGGGATDTLTTSNVWFRVERGQSPSPFLPVGPFTATWTSEVSVELRGDYQFLADRTGEFRLAINGTNVLGPGVATETNGWSAPIRLRKGANRLTATLARTNDDVASVRLEWRGRGLPAGPIPAAAWTWTPPPDAASEAGARRARGRGLFLEYRCGHCHAPGIEHPVVDFDRDAPRFDGMGSRLQAAWMRRWVRDPLALRPDARMPQLLHGAGAEDEAMAISAWLGSLTNGSPASPRPSSPKGQAAIGRAFAESQHCRACHAMPGEPDDPTRVSLANVATKFQAGELAAFLRKPTAAYRWSPMPDFRLTEDEAAHLAAWLTANPAPAAAQEPAPPSDPALVARGKALVESRGCLGCHLGPAENRARAKPLAELPAEAWTRGCLAEAATGYAGVPHYRFTAEERLDLRAFAASDRASLGRDVPAEFAGRMTQELRCTACHDAVEGLPNLSGAGGKLRPEWLTRLLAGEVPGKTRTWLPARMPAFPAVAGPLAAGLAAQHGRLARSPEEPPIDPAAAGEGRKLVSASGGFACVTCHAIGGFGATAVFEAPGINLAKSGERLLPDYFARWVRNPQQIDPNTKMPLYFDEDGNSALTDFYGGDGPKTLRALWHYVRQGEAMPPPAP